MNINSSRWRAHASLVVAALCAVLSLQASAAAQVLEQGKFRLHKFQLPIGAESYEIRREGDSLVIKSDFAFTDRSTSVPLSATLRTRQDLTPERFEIKGKTSRFSDIDTLVEIQGGTAQVRVGKETRPAAALPERFFTISGYAPMAVQMSLVRYWLGHARPASLKTLPGGEVQIEHRGRDEIMIGGKPVTLERYSIAGLIWGRESLWFDASNQLIAVATNDAEFDRFEAVREGYETALPVFVAKAAEDGMASLARLANDISRESRTALAITGATVVDGTGKAPLANAVVVVQQGRITAVGRGGQVKIPRGARIVDARGRTVLPGLWDMHAHFSQVEWGPIYLAAGVTTVRDVGNEFEFITAVRDAIRTGRGLGPRMLLAGIVDGNSPMALGVVHADTPEEAVAVVRRYHAAGFEQMKLYSSLKPEVVRAIAAEAHRLGMTVTGHVPEGMNAYQGVEAGMDMINHIQYVFPLMLPKNVKPQPGQTPKIDFNSEEARAALKFFKEHGTVIDPTLAIFELIWRSTDIPAATFEPGILKVAPELAGPLNNFGVPPAQAPRLHAIHEQFLAIVGALHRAGVPIVAGTDQVVPGHSLHRELELYVKAGMTPLEAIQTATIVPARVMKLDKETGTVEVGKRADLIIVGGNPLANISDIRKVETVVTNGRIYNTAPLWRSVGFKP